MAWFALIAALAFGVMFRWCCWAPSPGQRGASRARAGQQRRPMAQGWSAWQRGAFEEAVVAGRTPRNAMLKPVSRVLRV